MLRRRSDAEALILASISVSSRVGPAFGGSGASASASAARRPAAFLRCSSGAFRSSGVIRRIIRSMNAGSRQNNAKH